MVYSSNSYEMACTISTHVAHGKVTICSTRVDGGRGAPTPLPRQRRRTGVSQLTLPPGSVADNPSTASMIRRQMA